MMHHLRRILFFGTMLFLLSLIASACDAIGDSGNNTQQTSNQGSATTNSQQATAPSGNTTAISQVVTPVTSQGTPGTGPIVITTPTRVVGGGAHSQQITLTDRVIVIDDVSRQAGTNGAPTTVILNITIKNTGNKAIMNSPTFFQLVGAEGDFFGQTNSSDDFSGSIAAHTARSGVLVFQIPGGAASNLRLMYRSEVLTETFMVTLNT